MMIGVKAGGAKLQISSKPEETSVVWIEPEIWGLADALDVGLSPE